MVRGLQRIGATGQKMGSLIGKGIVQYTHITQKLREVKHDTRSYSNDNGANMFHIFYDSTYELYNHEYNSILVRVVYT